MDSYQPIYDAVRSKINGGNVGEVVERAAREAFDLGPARYHFDEAVREVANEYQRPAVLFKPQISADGDQWCALLGDNLQEGVSGFGKTPSEAMAAFDVAFWKGQTPSAIRLAGRRQEGALAATTAMESHNHSEGEG